MRGARGVGFARVEGEQFRAQFAEVDFLRVGRAFGVWGRGGGGVSRGGKRGGRVGGGWGGGGAGGLPSRRTMVRVRFWMDSSMTSLRTRIMAMACSSEKPSSLRRCTNFSVSKWWSRWSGGVVWKGRGRGRRMERAAGGKALRDLERGARGFCWRLEQGCGERHAGA